MSRHPHRPHHPRRSHARAATAFVAPTVKVTVAAALAFALAAATSSAAAHPAARPIDPPPPAAAPTSAIVVLDAPSVADRLAASGWPAWRRLAVDVAAAAAQTDARARLQALHAATLASQADVLARAAVLGLDVVARYAVVGNGVQVHGRPADIVRLAEVAGVARIEAAPRLRPMLDRSVPRIGADVVHARLGLHGAGQTIAIIDTGIDYTHRAFGGPGTAAAYAAASGAAERIDDAFDGRPLFPNERVVGGWDFVGPNYTSPGLCAPGDEAAGLCTSTPHPDPDPLDAYGHGTAVAGIAGSQGGGDVAPGVAPAASLVALKVYGPPARAADTDEAVDVVIDALEWCAAANLGLERRGAVPQRVDVINMSLGEPWAQGSRFFDAAIDAAVNAGIVVVAAAGNQADHPFVLTAPGSSPRALSVAASSAGVPVDAIGTYSSRGPGRSGALKPDLTAPGTGIRTAGMGSGGGAAVISGTSMASPHVAGAAALVLQRLAAGSTTPIGASDVAARIVNATRPVVNDGRGDRPVGVTRQGAGRLDVARAVTATLSVRVGDGAAVNLGRWPRTALAARTSVLEAYNPTAAAITFTLAAAPRPGAPPALHVGVPPEPLVAPPYARVPVTVTFQPVEPARLPSGNLGVAGTIASGALEAATADGWLRFALLDAADRPRPDAVAPSVPYAAIFRAASAATVTIDGEGSAAPVLHIAQPDLPGATSAAVELFHRLTPAEGDPDEPGVRYEADVRHVGASWRGVDSAAAGEGGDVGGARLSIGIARHAPAVVPYGVLVRVLLDIDGDGRIDRVAAAGPENAVLGSGGDDAMVVGVARWDPDAAAPIGRLQPIAPLPFTVDSRVLSFDVPLADLGLAAPRRVSMFVESRGLLEDWLPLDDGDGLSGAAIGAVDVVPDGASATDGRAPRLVVPAPGERVAPVTWRVAVPPGGAVDVALEGVCGAAEGSFLALIPTNPAAADGGVVDVAVVEPGTAQARRAGGCKVWLPVGWRGILDRW